MSTIPNRCPICGGAKRKGSTTFTADLQFGVLVVRNVPAWICEQCGETWIEDEVAERLEELVEEARIRKPVVEVAQWEPQVA